MAILVQAIAVTDVFVERSVLELDPDDGAVARVPLLLGLVVVLILPLRNQACGAQRQWLKPGGTARSGATSP